MEHTDMASSPPPPPPPDPHLGVAMPLPAPPPPPRYTPPDVKPLKMKEPVWCSGPADRRGEPPPIKGELGPPCEAEEDAAIIPLCVCATEEEEEEEAGENNEC